MSRLLFSNLPFFMFQNLDLRTHKLIYEGSLNWRIGNRQKLIDIHVLLLHDVIILLQKQDEKYVLKFYNVNTPSGGAPALSPIVKVSSVLVRDNAVGELLGYIMSSSHHMHLLNGHRLIKNKGYYFVFKSRTSRCL